jgi:hypothetical protein
MKRLQHLLLTATVAAVALQLPALAAGPRDRDYAYYDGYESDPRSRRGPAGRDAIAIVDYDIRSMMRAAYSRVDNEKRRLFNDTLYDLERFRVNARRGRFDTDRLDGAIDNMKRLVGSNQIPPRMKDVLVRDIQLLREFRANRGYTSRNRW